MPPTPFFFEFRFNHRRHCASKSSSLYSPWLHQDRLHSANCHYCLERIGPWHIPRHHIPWRSRERLLWVEDRSWDGPQVSLLMFCPVVDDEIWGGQQHGEYEWEIYTIRLQRSRERMMILKELIAVDRAESNQGVSTLLIDSSGVKTTIYLLSGTSATMFFIMNSFSLSFLL